MFSRKIVGVDPSDGYTTYARIHLPGTQVQFRVASAQALPFEPGSFDAVVSGLVLNFVPDPEQAVAEMRRVVRPGGIIAAHVWDYGGKMEMMRYFWDSAVALNAEATDLDEGAHFPLCHSENLRQLFAGVGLQDITVEAIDVPTPFHAFDGYWLPFLGGSSPAPGYAMSLSDEDHTALRDHVRSRLPIAADGSIGLIARAWAIRGRP